MCIRIANTSFESELLQNTLLPLDQLLAQNNVYRALQLTPFFYGGPQDTVLLTEPPSPDFISELENFGIPPLRWCLPKSPPSLPVDSWGASLSIEAWAQKHRLTYNHPPLSVVRAVNSKEFSFTHAPKLPGAELLRTVEQAEAWIAKTPGHKVLKTRFGVSGRGHLFLPSPHTAAFLTRELPVIAEPWVDRAYDFSTQWVLSQETGIHYLGATLCENDVKGRYRSNRAGHLSIEHLDAHKVHALPLLEQMLSLGYFGNVGIDAMVYRSESGPQLHPIVEINARKTMGFVALELQKRHFSNKTITLSFHAGGKRHFSINVGT